jgi:transposase
MTAEETRLSDGMKQLILMLREQWVSINRQVDALEAELRAIVERDDACKRLASIPGIGAITASAIVAAIGDGRMFRSGRDFAAWLGLVPRQHSTGGRSTLLGISKRGNTYIRTLLVHGSRCMLRFEILIQRLESGLSHSKAGLMRTSPQWRLRTSKLAPPGPCLHKEHSIRPGRRSNRSCWLTMSAGGTEG